MAETSKNKIYYNDDENSVADVLTDMKKLAQSVDNAIEKSKYNDTQIKKDISNMKTEITAKDNAQDNKILKLQTEKAYLEKELKEAQEDIYQASIRGQASGEYIHVEDSSNCRARIGISGNQEQETRSGKNLLELMEGTYSNNGITAVVKNGIVTLNGTATAISFVGINLLKSIELTNDKAYHLSAFNEKTVGDNTNYCSLRINQDNIQVLFNTANVNGSITTNLKISYITIRTAQGITYNNFVVKPQLELGAGTKEWEQGGIAPSSDYQSPVKTVGSNVNYYNKETEKIGFVLSDGSLQPNNTVWTHSDFIEVNSNEIISITCENKANGQFAIVEYDKNKKFLKHNMGNYVNTEANNKFTITTTETTKYIIGAYRNNLNMNNIMVVKGAEVLPYNPNCNNQGSVKVTKCNKNIYNKNKEIICNEVGIGSSGELFSRSDQKLLIIPISKTKTNIVISLTKTFSYSLRYAFSDKIVENIDCKIFDTGYVENSTTINIKVNKTVQNNKHNYLLLSFTKKDIYPDLQVEYKKEVSQYEEHQEQSYIMPVQKEMLTDDYFDWDNEEEVHVWGNVIVNGTETINKNPNSEFFSITKSMSQFDTSATGIEQSISNYGTGTTLALGSGNTNNKYSFNASTIYLDCYNSNINTVEKLKVQLTKNNMKIYAKLATPTRLKFTEEQKAVAKELNNARTYKNVTNITTDSKAILDLDYAKDLETLLTSKESEV